MVRTALVPLSARLMGLALPAAWLGLTGCGDTRDVPLSPAPAAATVAAVAPSATTDPTHAPESLVGEYRVVGIDGTLLEADFGIALSIDGRRISYEPMCAGFVWTYTYRDGVLSAVRALEYGPTRQPDGSILVCAVAVPPELRRLGQAIDAATRAVRTPANAIELTGKGRSVMLFSQ